MKTRKFRTALIGCGVIAKNHLIPLRENKNVEIAALCDTDSSRAEKLNEELGLCAKIYTDYKEMLDTESVDSVHIATPHYMHAEMTIAALRKNINVFLEKPMCIREREIDEMINAEKASKASVCVCFQNRMLPSVKETLRIINEDGGAVNASLSLYWKRDKAYYESGEWRGRIATEGGGVMINQAIHYLDLLIQIFGTPQSVCATTANHSLKGVIEVEDTCEGVITFKSGKRANFYTTNSYSHDAATIFAINTKSHRLILDFPTLILDGVTMNIKDDGIVIGKECYGTGHALLINKFYDALADGAPMPVPLASAKDAVKLILAAYKSQDTEIII